MYMVSMEALFQLLKINTGIIVSLKRIPDEDLEYKIVIHKNHCFQHEDCDDDIISTTKLTKEFMEQHPEYTYEVGSCVNVYPNDFKYLNIF